MFTITMHGWAESIREITVKATTEQDCRWAMNDIRRKHYLISFEDIRQDELGLFCAAGIL